MYIYVCILFSEEAQYTTPNGQRLLQLSKYEEAISKYEGVRESIQQLQSPMDVGWLRFNTQPIKSQLMTWISKWVEMFLSHLKVMLRIVVFITYASEAGFMCFT
jgi:hypothetical protein